MVTKTVSDRATTGTRALQVAAVTTTCLGLGGLLVFAASTADSDPGTAFAPTVQNLASTGAPNVTPPPATPPADAASMMSAKNAALASPPVTAIVGSNSYTVVGVFAASTGTTPDQPMLAVDIGLSTSVPFPPGIPTLRAQQDNSAPQALDSAVVLSTTSVLRVSEVTVLINPSTYSVFAVLPGGKNSGR